MQNVEDVIYQLRVIIEGVSPLIWRRILVPGNYSIADLHYILQLAFDWDNDYLHRFEIYGKDYGIGYLGGMSFSDNPHQVRLNDFKFRKGEKFFYEYNFFENWKLIIRVEEILQVDLRKKYPTCTGGNNLRPTKDYREDEFSLEWIQDESTILLGEKLKEFSGLYKKFLDCLMDEENAEQSIAIIRGQAQELLEKGEEIKTLSQVGLPETFKRRRLNRILLQYSKNRGVMPEEEDDEIQGAGARGKC